MEDGDPLDTSPLLQAGLILESLGNLDEAAVRPFYDHVLRHSNTILVLLFRQGSKCSTLHARIVVCEVGLEYIGEHRFTAPNKPGIKTMRN